MLFSLSRTIRWRPAIGSSRVRALYAPQGVKVLGHYQLLGQQRIVIIAEAESAEALARITAPWTDVVSIQIFPAMAWADYYQLAYLSKKKPSAPEGRS